ncbi:nitroreductase family protein, partial [Porcincola intestinalis]
MAETNVVLDAIRSRRSCRAYKSEMVPKELIKTVAEAGTWAATGMGRQSPVIVAVTDKAVRDELSEMNAKIM